VLDSSGKHAARNVNMDGSTGTEAPPAPLRLISLGTLSSKKDNSANKRTRSSMSHVNDPEQPASKKHPQNASAPSLPVLDSRDHVPARRTRNQEKEKEIEDEVRKSCQNVRWTRALPRNIDHWFYDLRDAGMEPPESLVAASRIMVLKWKEALGHWKGIPLVHP
jgi:hypothetical protein